MLHFHLCAGKKPKLWYASRPSKRQLSSGQKYYLNTLFSKPIKPCLYPEFLITYVAYIHMCIRCNVLLHIGNHIIVKRKMCQFIVHALACPISITRACEDCIKNGDLPQIMVWSKTGPVRSSLLIGVRFWWHAVSKFNTQFITF